MESIYQRLLSIILKVELKSGSIYKKIETIPVNVVTLRTPGMSFISPLHSIQLLKTDTNQPLL